MTLVDCDPHWTRDGKQAEKEKLRNWNGEQVLSLFVAFFMTLALL